jgi:hypothetical protein
VVLAGALEAVEAVGVLDETGVDEGFCEDEVEVALEEDALDDVLEVVLEDVLEEAGVDNALEVALEEAATEDALVAGVADWLKLADDEDEADWRLAPQTLPFWLG